MNWEWHELVDGQDFFSAISEHLLVHSLALLALHEHLPCSSPMSCSYLTDIDSRVLLIIGSVTDSQPQLLLAANATQLHLLQENIQAFVVVLAKGGKNCIAQGSTRLLRYSCCTTYSSCSILRQNVMGRKLLCELRRKSQYNPGSSYIETVQ